MVDTQTDWTIVQSKECPAKDCLSEGERYDREVSTSQKKSPISTESITFGSGKVLGRTTNDKMCLETNWGKDICVETGFSFFEVTKTEGIALLSQYSGILGVAPDDKATGPSFVDKLKEEGIIDRKMISLLIQKKPLSSYVTFGGKTDFMMITVNRTQPIIWYNSTSLTTWKLKVMNTHIRDSEN